MRTSPARLLQQAGAVATLILTGACHPAPAAQSQCAAPPAWPAADAKPGHPDDELAACLKAQAWEARSLAIPAQSAVAGVIAQCEIRVDKFEGGPPADQDAREARANQLAVAAVAESRQCAGK